MTGSDHQPRSLEQFLDHLQENTTGDGKVAVRTLLDIVGTRSFAPVLLLVGLVMFSPLSGIPGMSTISATLVLLTSVQVLCGREYFWVPGWLARRSIPRHRLQQALRSVRPVVRGADRVLKPRLTFLTDGVGTYLIAGLCIGVASVVPLMEIIPFLATTAGFILLLLGLALIARDGLFALIAISLIAMVVAAGVLRLT